MERLMQANLQIIELLGAVFEEVDRQGERAAAHGHERPSPLRRWVGRPRADDVTVPPTIATN